MLASLFDNIYGAWFLPARTFRSFREQPPLWQALLIVAWLNLVDTGRRVGFSPSDLPVVGLSVISGILGWVILSSILFLLSYCFNLNPRFPVLLTLTGFAGLPWLLLAPAQTLGGSWGGLFGLLALGWFGVWQIWAAAVALELPWYRIIWLIPLTFVGALLSISWIGSSITALVSLS